MLPLSIYVVAIFSPRQYQRRKDELQMRRRLNRNRPVWRRMSDMIPMWLMLNYRNKYGLIFATATVLIGLYAYLKAAEGNVSILR